VGNLGEGGRRKVKGNTWEEKNSKANKRRGNIMYFGTLQCK